MKAPPNLYKLDGTPVTDYSWMLVDTGKYTCMQKFHLFYLPQGLFNCGRGFTKTKGHNMNPDANIKVATLKLSCALYKTRQKALGLGDIRGCKNRKKGKAKAMKTAVTNDDSNDEETETDDEYEEKGKEKGKETGRA